MIQLYQDSDLLKDFLILYIIVLVVKQKSKKLFLVIFNSPTNIIWFFILETILIYLFSGEIREIIYHY